MSFLIFGTKTGNASVQVGAAPSERFHIPLQTFIFLSLLACVHIVVFDVLLCSSFGHSISYFIAFMRAQDLTIAFPSEHKPKLVRNRSVSL